MEKKKLNLSHRNTYDVKCFGIDKYDKLHDFMIHSVMLAVCRILRENYYSIQFQMLAAM